MPPAARETIELDGSLGLETNVSRHSGDERSFRVFRDLVTDVAHRILKRDGKGPTLGNVAGTEIQALAEYVFVDPTNGNETYHTLGAIDGGFFIYRWNGATTWVGQTLPITPSGGGRWGFQNADNRVFAFNGKDALLIGEQPNSVLASLTSVGLTATATTPFPHAFLTGDSVTVLGALQAPYNVTAAITVTSPTTFTYAFAGSGTSPATGTISASALTTIRWRIAGIDAPSFAPAYSLTAANPPYSTGLVSAVQGSPTITGAVPAIWLAAFDNMTIRINGNDYLISTVDVAGDGVAVAPVLTLQEPFKEVTAGGMIYTIFWGVGSWDDIAPQYQFSWYNPTTGHVSNPSPLVQVTETFRKDVTPTVTIPGSAENTTAYNNGYAQIQLYRTPKNAGTMVVLNEKLANNNAGNPIVYTETAVKFLDTYLGNLQAPLLNYKPPVGISSMTVQQGRVWAVHRLSGSVRFTPIRAEVEFGRASECWPPLYQLDQLQVPAPRGLLTIGSQSSADSLVIQTAKGDYSVDGFSSITFSPYRLDTNESGGYLGAAVSARSRLIEFYADDRLLLMQQELAMRIQDRLNAIKPSLISKVRLHWFSAGSRNYLLLSIPSTGASTANDYTYVFDLDLGWGPIYEWPFGVSAFATVHDASTGAIQLLMGDASGAIYRLFTGVNQDAGVNFAPTLLTHLFRGDELRKDLKYVKLFVNDAQLGSAPLTGWTGILYLNEQNDPAAVNGEAVSMIFRQMPYRQQSAQGRELVWTPTVSLRTRSKVFQIAITFPTVNGPLWIEQMIIGDDLDQMLAPHPFNPSLPPVAGGQQA